MDRDDAAPGRGGASTVAIMARLLVLVTAFAVVGVWALGLRSSGGPAAAATSPAATSPAATSPGATSPALPGGSGLIGCWGRPPGFSPDLVSNPNPSAETVDGAPAAALRALLAMPYSGMPASGWIVVSESSSQVMFLHPGAEPGQSVEVTVAPGSTGLGLGAEGWSVGGYGSCRLSAIPPAGYGIATWTLDPSVPYTAGATDLHILVDEMACHGEQTATGRIAASVDYGTDTVVVTVSVRSLEGPQTCPAPPPTPYVLHLDQPVGARGLADGGVWPVQAIVVGGQAVIAPTPTPQPSNWHEPIDCTGEADGPGSFKAASMSASFDVYCAVLPDGWKRQSMSGDLPGATTVAATYGGPNGETLQLVEGDACLGGASDCPGGTDLGTAMFGDREGMLVGAPPGADFALDVDAGRSPSWRATGTGMSLDTFKALTAALIVVMK
jgi:hypothetical protein